MKQVVGLTVAVTALALVATAGMAGAQTLPECSLAGDNLPDPPNQPLQVAACDERTVDEDCCLQADGCRFGKCKAQAPIDGVAQPLICQFFNYPAGSACVDDGFTCTDDVCEGGSAIEKATCDHVPVDSRCDDSEVCTDETCDPAAQGAVASGCLYTNNSNSCDDGLFCTAVDQCSGGQCVGTGDPCAGGSQCNNSCNESANNCFNPAGDPCDRPQGIECPDYGCNGEGGCEPTPVDNCPDGQSCDLHGICVDPGCLTNADCAETPVDNPCTIDECNTETGECLEPGAYDCTADPKNTLCAAATCDSRFALPNCEGPLLPINEGGRCDDGTTCTPVDVCRSGQCIGYGCGDPDRDGVRSLGDCLEIVTGALRPASDADGIADCPLDACDLNGNCKVDISDALGCLHCAVGLETCAWFNKCPIAVGFVMYSSSDGDNWAPDETTEFADFLSGINYSKAPGEFCGSGPGNVSPYPADKPHGGTGELYCETLLNQTNTNCSGSAVYPDDGETVLPTASTIFSEGAGCPADAPFVGPTFGRCFFVQDPLARMDICDPGFDIPAAFQTLATDGFAPNGTPANLTVCTVAGPRCGDRVCEHGEPATCPGDCSAPCGNGECDPLDDENGITCPADCLMNGGGSLPPSSTPACVP